MGLMTNFRRYVRRRVMPESGVFWFDTEDGLKIAAEWPTLLAQSLYFAGTYHPETVNWLKENIRPDDVCVDVGANVGYLTCIMAMKCNRVYAFEPNGRMYNLLVLNLLRNRITNTLPCVEAVAERLGVARFFDNVEPMYSGLIGHNGMTDIRHVTTVALDEATPEATLVKIDVEGAEYRVLKGMKKLMEKQGFRFIIEIEPDRQGFSNEVYDLLEGWKLNKLDSLNMLCEQEQERI